MKPGLLRRPWVRPGERGTLILVEACETALRGGMRRSGCGAPGQTWMLVTGCALSVRFMVPAMTLLGPSS